jgi:hypothetical protein
MLACEDTYRPVSHGWFATWFANRGWPHGPPKGARRDEGATYSRSDSLGIQPQMEERCMRTVLLITILLTTAPAICFATDQVQPKSSNPSEAASGQKAAPGTHVTPKAHPGGLSVAVPLTGAECTKLGGVIGASNKACTDAGQFTCTTTTITGSGTIESNQACIDKK